MIFPFQIQTLIFKSILFSGQFNPFASLFLGLSEIVLWAALFFSAIHLIIGGKNKRILFNVQDCFLLMYLLIGVISVFFASDKVFSLLLVFREIELVILYFLIASGILSKKEILKYFLE